MGIDADHFNLLRLLLGRIIMLVGGICMAAILVNGGIIYNFDHIFILRVRKHMGMVNFNLIGAPLCATILKKYFCQSIGSLRTLVWGLSNDIWDLVSATFYFQCVDARAFFCVELGKLGRRSIPYGSAINSLSFLIFSQVYIFAQNFAIEYSSHKLCMMTIILNNLRSQVEIQNLGFFSTCRIVFVVLIIGISEE